MGIHREFTLGSGQIGLLNVVFQSSNLFGNLPMWIHAFNPLTLKDIQEITVLAQKYPATPVIIGHLGGSNWLETIELAKQIPNLYLDLSANFSTLVLKMAIMELPEKSIFGVDLPYGDLLIAKQTVERVCNDSEILKCILGGNIGKLLKL